ncbi:hypothetical protein LC609_29175 [Nostoc sp. XA013]|nr:hypothetical protein [Nostoc sp. XA013]
MSYQPNKKSKTFRSMKFSDLQRGDLFCFPSGEDTYKKIGDRLAMPMCSRMNHVADVRSGTEVIGIKPSAYSRDREENMPDFDGLIWELQCQLAEMGG